MSGVTHAAATVPEQSRRSDTEPGRPWPLGAHCIDGGVNFALFSAHATKVELCLFSADGVTETERIPLRGKSDDVWHVFLPDCKAGTLYGYRVHGPYEPWNGHRFNPHKLLLDPYARVLSGSLTETQENLGYLRAEPGSEEGDHNNTFDTRDNAHNIPKCVVLDRSIRHDTGVRPLTPMQETVIYEAHVKGLSRSHPKVAKQQRGTYLGVASDALLEHYKELGVTAIELLPVHLFCDDDYLLSKYLVNYWGYNSLCFFVPDARYASQDAVDEFRQMVRRLDEHGLEVILDVVYNHTAEGAELGPTLSFRGIDNKSYYRLAEDPRQYINDSGCGNTMNCDHPRVTQLILDSLRYWVEDMGVDGFRFDLASILGREPGGFSNSAGFFKAVCQDPVLASVKLIAEPWDCGLGGYQTGNFPLGWSEWNDQYRDAVKKFWLGEHNTLQALSRALHGSSEVFEWQGKSPQASINFITSHDGFTLLDLVSYVERHNQANKEDNKDGHHGNFSCNHGVEGQIPATHPDAQAIYADRDRHRRNLIATLFLSQGVPMLLAGDELGRTQSGNNNAYCQDSPLTWLDWQHTDKPFLKFVRRLIRLRKHFPVLRQQQYLHGESDSPSLARSNISWLNEHGQDMSDNDWLRPDSQFLGLLLAGDAEDEGSGAVASGADGNNWAHMLILMNNSPKHIKMGLPKGFGSGFVVLDTASADETVRAAKGRANCRAHSVLVVASKAEGFS